MPRNDPSCNPGRRNPGSIEGPERVLSRRRVLTGGGGLLALGLTVSPTAACGSGRSNGPDPLQSVLAAARNDSELAAAAARTAPTQLAPALLVISAERARHAGALIEELSRAAGEPTPTPGAAAPAPPSPTSTGPAPPPPSVNDVVDALRLAGESAATLAPTQSGYRAGLLGSIAAACMTSATVGLTPLRKPR
ncbi:MAG: hypothetical protein WBC17_06945 [Mycobacterium sp.]